MNHNHHIQYYRKCRKRHKTRNPFDGGLMSNGVGWLGWYGWLWIFFPGERFLPFIFTFLLRHFQVNFVSL